MKIDDFNVGDLILINGVESVVENVDSKYDRILIKGFDGRLDHLHLNENCQVCAKRKVVILGKADLFEEDYDV